MFVRQIATISTALQGQAATIYGTIGTKQDLPAETSSAAHHQGPVCTAPCQRCASEGAALALLVAATAAQAARRRLVRNAGQLADLVGCLPARPPLPAAAGWLRPARTRLLGAAVLPAGMHPLGLLAVAAVVAHLAAGPSAEAALGLAPAIAAVEVHAASHAAGPQELPG